MITCCAQDVEDTRAQERSIECLRRRHFAGQIAQQHTVQGVVEKVFMLEDKIDGKPKKFVNHFSAGREDKLELLFGRLITCWR